MSNDSVLITGAGGAYAHYLAARFKAAGYGTIGISRSDALPSNLYDHHIRADVGDDASIQTISQELDKIVCPVSVVVANAGQRAPTDGLLNLHSGELLDLLNVHCFSLLRTLHGSWKWKTTPLKLVAVSSRFSSFYLHQSGMFRDHRPLYSYSIAKAALNMFCMRLRAEHPASELKIYLVHPGRLTVGVSAVDASDDPDVSAMRLVRYIAEYPGDEVRLYDVMEGATIPW
jgi:short-subunit dehydrogenase